jgi:hypothetical protein
MRSSAQQAISAAIGTLAASIDECAAILQYLTSSVGLPISRASRPHRSARAARPAVNPSAFIDFTASQFSPVKLVRKPTYQIKVLNMVAMIDRQKPRLISGKPNIALSRGVARSWAIIV